MTTPDGRAAVGLNPDGVADPTLTVVRLDGEDDRPVATIVHYACHPIILGPDNTYVTPEYPGIVKRVVEAALGGHCLFVQGACGDVGPRELFVPDLVDLPAARRDARPRGGRDRLPRVVASASPAPARGRGLGVDRVVRVRARRRAGRDRRGRAGDRSRCPCGTTSATRPHWRRDASAARTRPTPRAMRARRTAEVRELTVRTKFARMRAERGDALAGLDAYPLLVHGIRLGPVALLGVPVELFSEIGTGDP